MNISTSTATTFQKLEIENFALVERGFFAEELEVLNKFGNPLPTLINDSNESIIFLDEGQDFIVTTKIYERGIGNDQDLNIFIVEAFLYDVSDVNKIFEKEIIIELEDIVNETTITFNELFNGIITTNSDLPPLTKLKIRVRLCGKRVDTGATNEPVCYAEQETRNLFLRQFPYSPEQFLLNLTIDEFFVGESPEGEFFVETDNIEAIQYVVISVFDSSGSAINSDVNETFYKGTDFDCFADFCTFRFRLSDWAFESAQDYTAQATIKVTTEELNYNNDLLNKIIFLQAYHIGYAGRYLNEYNNSRDVRTYKGYERIPLILNIKDNLNFPTRDDLNIVLRVWDLGTADFNGNGDALSTFDIVASSWDYYNYDVNKGLNSYGWAGRLRDFDGTLENNHFYRLLVVVNDSTKKRENINPITLSGDTSTGGWESDTNAFEQNNEVSIKIDESITLDAPIIDQNGLNSLYCTAPANNDVEQRLHLNSLSTLSLAPLNPIGYFLEGGIRFISSVILDLIYRDCTLMWVDQSFYVDTIRVYVYNDYSDLTETQAEFKQYMDFTFGEELIIFNDGLNGLNDTIAKSPSACKSEFGADAIGRYLCALGSLGNLNIQEFMDESNTLSSDIQNLFFNGEDLNTIQTINPKTKFLKFQVRNLRPINVVDFEKTAEIDFTRIPDQKILKYLKNDLDLKISNQQPAIVDVFQNGLKIKTIELPNNLVDRLNYNQYIDTNGVQVAQFDYSLRVDLCYNSGRNCLTPQINQFSEKVLLKEPLQPLNTSFSRCIGSVEGMAGCTFDFFATPEIFVFSFGLVLVGIILLFAYVMLTKKR